jgi:hypothetical protein
MMHYLYSLPDFFSAILIYWVSIVTGSVIAAGLWLLEHYRKTAITWGWCVAIALFSLFVSCTLAWIDEHDLLVNAMQKANTEAANSAKKTIETRRGQKAQMQRAIYEVTAIIERQLPWGENRGLLMVDDPRFQQYETDADKWISDTSTWLLENLGEKAQRQFIDISHTEPHGNGGRAESVNQVHLQIMVNLQKYRENLRLMVLNFSTGEPLN